MLKLQLGMKKDRCLRVLCLGSHCDDIEIGCGGTILKLIGNYSYLIFYWVVFSSDRQRKNEASESAKVFLKDVKEKNIVIKNFKDSFFPFGGAEIKEYFEEIKDKFLPDIIFTHYRQDLHQDHRLISELTWNTFRDHLILEYEIPKYDGDLGSPNLFVHLNENLCQRKIKYILGSFRTQRRNHWFNKETFESMLRLRGMEANAPERFAEAFYCRKLVCRLHER